MGSIPTTNDEEQEQKAAPLRAVQQTARLRRCGSSPTDPGRLRSRAWHSSHLLDSEN